MVNVRWKDKSNISSASANDYIPITKNSDNNDYYVTPDQLKSYTTSNITTDNITEWATNLYDKVVSILAWAWISVSWAYPNFTVDNTSPDQVVALTALSGSA